MTLTATVSPGAATGTVMFYDGAPELGTGTLNSSGVATLSVNARAIGPVSLTATYVGDANDIASTSAALIVTINESDEGAAAHVGRRFGGRPAVRPGGDVYEPPWRRSHPAWGRRPGTVSFYDGANLLGSGTLFRRHGDVHHLEPGGGHVHRHGLLRGTAISPEHHGHDRDRRRQRHAGYTRRQRARAPPPS